MANYREIVHPDYTLMFFICKDRKCNQKWVSAGRFETKDAPLPQVFNINDAKCPSCSNTEHILDTWGIYGCTLIRLVFPGEPLLLPRHV